MVQDLIKPLNLIKLNLTSNIGSSTDAALSKTGRNIATLVACSGGSVWTKTDAKTSLASLKSREGVEKVLPNNLVGRF